MGTTALKLHLGCGSSVIPGWVNIDKSPSVLLGRIPMLRSALAAASLLTAEQAAAVFPRGIIHADVRRGLPHADGAARYIYSSHMIEHMARWQGLALVRECARVLEPGGVLRLATPDLVLLVASYERSREAGLASAADRFMEDLLTFVEQPGSRVSRILRRLFTAPHQWLYDGESLSLMLEEGGFVEIAVRGFRDSELPEIELLENREDSLFVEARRP